MICRLCLSNLNEGSEFAFFNSNENNTESNSIKMISKYFQLEISLEDTISTSVCNECWMHLEDFDKFCKYVEEKQFNLRSEFIEIKCTEEINNALAEEEVAEPNEEPLLDIKDIRKDATDTTILAAAAEVKTALKPIINRMIADIQMLRTEIKELKRRGCPKRQIMPNNPFNKMEEFNAFEKLLQEDNDAFSSFQKDLEAVSRKTNYVKNCWRKLITDRLGENLCWSGTEEKRSVRNLSTSIAIRNATISLGMNEEEFIRNTKSFFQFAKNRQKQRLNYTKQK